MNNRTRCADWRIETQLHRKPDPIIASATPIPDPQSAVPRIVVASVSKTYATPGGAAAQPVLREVTLDVPRNAFIALMGSSGSGKTTLLNLIGGLDTPDAGTIEVDGVNLNAMGDAERSGFRLRHFGFVFQFFNLLPHLSVRENIALPLLLLRHAEGEAHERARALAGEMGLGDKFDRRVHQLSGGEMQRVALARALVHEPGILLADEPTGNLDSHTGEVILNLIRDLRARHNLTILMVTHDPEAAAAADTILHMRDGALVGD